MKKKLAHWLTDEEALELCSHNNKIEAFIASAIVNVKGKWYHMNITFDKMCGPFDIYDECKRACESYARTAYQWS